MGLFTKDNIDYIIVGLGNPGTKYADTRHNVGFIFIDYLIKKFSLKEKVKFDSLYCKVKLFNKNLIIMKPQTFMNNSGSAVYAVAKYYGVKPENIIVIYDDISLEPGCLRIKRNGSAGGHNGIKSIIEYIDSQNFPKIKIGVGKKPHPDYDLADWVLGKIPKSDREKIDSLLPWIEDALSLISSEGIDSAMNKYNSKSL